MITVRPSVVGRCTSIIWTTLNFSRTARGVNPGARALKTMAQRHMEGIGHEGHKDVRFDTPFFLMMDRPERQVSLEVLKRFFDVNQLSIELPHLGRIAANQVGSEEIPPLAAPGLSQPVLAQGKPEGFICCGDMDFHKPPCRR